MTFIETITAMASHNKLSEQETSDLIKGWEHYFAAFNILESEKLWVFQNAIQMRIIAGNFSLAASVPYWEQNNKLRK